MPENILASKGLLAAAVVLDVVVLGGTATSYFVLASRHRWEALFVLAV
jgi:hypothetical protein